MAHFVHGISQGLPWIALLLVVSFVAPRFGGRWLRLLEYRLSRISCHSGKSVLLCGALGLLVAIGSSLLLGIPTPAVHDEFSYLLAADTFAHGRLTNPSPPLWQFFESIHILVRPTYMSKYPPGQGLILALGQVLTGAPIVGIWISAALAAAALCWMLQGWLPKRTALLGGMLAAVHPLAITWGHDYWGGLLPLTGGALAIGAWRRTVDRALPWTAAMCGTGIAITALTRPYEGFVLAGLLAPSLLWLAWSRPVVPLRAWMVRCGAALLIPLVLYTGGIMVYNRAVTGSALHLPYLVHEQQYDPAPLFVWQPMRPIPDYRHSEIRDFYLRVIVPRYREQLGFKGFLNSSVDRLSNLLFQYLNPLTLALPLTALPWAARRDRWTRVALIAACFLTPLLLQNVYLAPHYIAPFAGIGCYVLLRSLRQIRTWRPHGRPVGRAIARFAIASVWFASLGKLTKDSYRHIAIGPSGPSAQRAQIIARLQQTPGDHLVVVRYRPDHDVHFEWVYNGADIDHERVIWAHDMGATTNRAMLAYFHPRRVWLLLADAKPPVLVPYPSAAN